MFSRGVKVPNIFKERDLVTGGTVGAREGHRGMLAGCGWERPCQIPVFGRDVSLREGRAGLAGGQAAADAGRLFCGFMEPPHPFPHRCLYLYAGSGHS